MTIGRPDLKVNYPERMVFYPVSVRHNNSSPSASFRFPVTRDTLAFGYKIPLITALLGLGGEIPLTLKTY
jgi:CRISPR-associated Cas5-like protein